jgi:hypothetical protein
MKKLIFHLKSHGDISLDELIEIAKNEILTSEGCEECRETIEWWIRTVVKNITKQKEEQMDNIFWKFKNQIGAYSVGWICERQGKFIKISNNSFGAGGVWVKKSEIDMASCKIETPKGDGNY